MEGRNQTQEMPRSIAALAVSLAITFVAPLVAVFAAPGTPEYYARIAKPEWTPPGWLFGPVWTVLYILMAVAMWRAWLCGRDARRRTSAVYLIQLVLNALWSPLFFGLHMPGLALGEIVLLWVAVLACLLVFSRVDWLAAALMAPYLAWVTFATALNFAIWKLN